MSSGHVQQDSTLLDINEHDTDNESNLQQFIPEEWIGCGLQRIHEGMYTANIGPYNPLRVGDVAIVLQPAKSKKESPILHVARVIAMYTKASYRGAKHEDVSQIESVGLPSNIYVEVLASLSVNIFTSLSCGPLACGTCLKIQRTHIIFSLASFTVNFQNFSTIDTHPFTMATLPPDAIDILTSIQDVLPVLIKAVADLKNLCPKSYKRSAGKTAAAAAGTSAEGNLNSGSEDSDSDASNGPED